MYGLVESRGGMSFSLVSMIASDPRSRAPPHGHLGHCVRAAFLVKIAFKTTQRVCFRLKIFETLFKRDGIDGVRFLLGAKTAVERIQAYPCCTSWMVDKQAARSREITTRRAPGVVKIN